MIDSILASNESAPRNAHLSVDAIVIGGGPAGIALAKGLKDQGYKVVLVERNAAPIPVFKGEYLQPRAVQILRNLGLGSVVESSEVNRVTELRFRDLGPDNVAVVSDIVMQYPKGLFAASLPHFQVLKKMRDLARIHHQELFFEGAQVTFEKRVRGQVSNVIQLKTKTGEHVAIHARWIFGTDGRNSTTRTEFNLGKVKKSGRPTIGTGPEYIVGTETQRTQPDGHRYEVIRTFQSGTVSAFRIAGDTHRVYWNAKFDKSVVNPKDLWNKELRGLFQTVPVLTKLGSVDNQLIHAAPANTSIASQTSKSSGAGSTVLVGDAAGVTTPFGGQGMTIGMLHVENILKTFDLKSNSLEQLEDYELFVRDTYQRINLINFGLYHFFFSRLPAAKIATHHVVSHWQNNPDYAERTMRLFGGLDLDTPSIRELFAIWGISSGTLFKDTLSAIHKTPLNSLPKWFLT